MFRWILTLFLVFGMATQVGCSFSSEEKDENTEAIEDADFEDDEEIAGEEGDEDEFEDGEEDGEESETVASEDFEGDSEDDAQLDGEESSDGDESSDDTGLDASLDDGGSETAEQGQDEESLPEDVATTAPSTGDETPVADNAMGESVDFGNVGDAPDENFSEVPEAKPVKKLIPVKKIADAPFEKGGQNLNSVYMARDGDTVADVAKKIYGSEDRKEDLLAANPNLRRGLKVGDKVYYNSPNRPADTDQMTTFHEDNGVPAQTYTTTSGENIREVAKNLLGNKRSSMEIWATNPDVESKWGLPEGTTLRYWPENDVAVGGPAEDAESVPQDVASDLPQKVESPPPPDPEPMGEVAKPIPSEPVAIPPADPAANSIPPADPVPQQAGSVPPQPVGGVNGNTPPPPPPQPIEPPPAPIETVAKAEIPPPPPPPPPKRRIKRKKKKKKSFVDSIMGKDSSENLLLVAGVLTLGLAGALIFIRRRRKAKRIEFTESE